MASPLIRSIILAATAVALVCLWLDRPAPVKAVQVDYCVIDYPAAARDAAGEWHYGWAHGYGPCSLLDRYENI